MWLGMFEKMARKCDKWLNNVNQNFLLYKKKFRHGYCVGGESRAFGNNMLILNIDLNSSKLESKGVERDLCGYVILDRFPPTFGFIK